MLTVTWGKETSANGSICEHKESNQFGNTGGAGTLLEEMFSIAEVNFFAESQWLYRCWWVSEVVFQSLKQYVRYGPESSSDTYRHIYNNCMSWRCQLVQTKL